MQQLMLNEKNYFKFPLEERYIFKDLGLSEIANEICQAYLLAEKTMDATRKNQYKNDFFQLLCIDHDLLRVKLEATEYGNNFRVKRYGLELSDSRIEKVVMEKLLKFKNNIDIAIPVKIKNYKGKIPFNIYQKMRNINKKFTNKKIDYYIADVRREPDPLFFVQFDNEKEYTFLIGVWE